MRRLFLTPFLLILAMPVWADARMTVLIDVLKLREAVHILRMEGVDYASDLNADMLNGQGGGGWDMQIDAIYDVDRVVEALRKGLSEKLQAETLEQAITFFGSDLGQKIVTLENSARSAISQQHIEDAARARYLELSETSSPRLGQVVEFVTVGDMISQNVTTAMNANYQFMRGLADGGALDMDDDEILSDVMGDMDDIQEDTTSWLYGYFLMAYHPLNDQELQSYVSFSKTPAGEALNQGLFDGFGRAYEDISYALGRAVALNMTAQDL